MGAAIKHPVPALQTWLRSRHFSFLSVRVPRCQQMLLNTVWHRMLYSCTHMATVAIKGLNLLVNFGFGSMGQGWFV